jgi:hypothetical protein
MAFTSAVVVLRRRSASALSMLSCACAGAQASAAAADPLRIFGHFECGRSGWTEMGRYWVRAASP